MIEEGLEPYSTDTFNAPFCRTLQHRVLRIKHFKRPLLSISQLNTPFTKWNTVYSYNKNKNNKSLLSRSSQNTLSETSSGGEKTNILKLSLSSAFNEMDGRSGGVEESSYNLGGKRPCFAGVSPNFVGGQINKNNVEHPRPRENNPRSGSPRSHGVGSIISRPWNESDSFGVSFPERRPRLSGHPHKHVGGKLPDFVGERSDEVRADISHKDILNVNTQATKTPRNAGSFGEEPLEISQRNFVAQKGALEYTTKTDPRSGSPWDSVFTSRNKFKNY